MVESLPANAGGTGSSPGLGRSHMPQSNWAREPQLLSLCVWSLCSATREAVIARGVRTAMKGGPRLPQLEKALAQKRRPNTAINKLKNKKQKKIPGPNTTYPKLDLARRWLVCDQVPRTQVGLGVRCHGLKSQLGVTLGK